MDKDKQRYQEAKQRNLDLAVIGNCTTAALLDSDGKIVWSCWPSFDANPLFSALIDQDEEGNVQQGFWAISLKNFSHSKQVYQRNTAIVETHLFDTEGNALRIIDFMPRFKDNGRVTRDLAIVRMIEPLAGQPLVTVRLRATDEYGAGLFKPVVFDDHMILQSNDQDYRLQTNIAPSLVADETAFVLREPCCFYLSENTNQQADITSYCQELLSLTSDYWYDFTKRLTLPPKWQEAVIRSAITLKLCTYEETGAVLAALTTSLPEADKTVRNWDYRYCWIRDSFFTVKALALVNETDTMENYLSFLQEITKDYKGGDIHPLFGLHYEDKIEEYVAENLKGFKGNKPVNIGNAAYSQVQNDSYASIIMAIEQMFYDQRCRQIAGKDLFEKLEIFGTQALDVWDKPDAGIWEYRGSQSVRTYSAVMCWAALDRLAKIARTLALSEREAFWSGHAATIKDKILEKAWNNDVESFVESFGGENYDASLLLLHEVGFIDPRDERYVKTVRKIGETLKKDHFLFRYIEQDDFGLPETFFTICTFWYISALVAIGEVEEAGFIFTQIMGKRNHVGLFSEDIDPENDALWGNFPQAYSMVGIICCALVLDGK